MKTFFGYTLMIVWLAAPWLGGCATGSDSGSASPGSTARRALLGEVEDAQDAQRQATAQLQSTLRTFAAVLDASESELPQEYRELIGQVADSKAAAARVHRHVRTMAQAAGTFFDRWRTGLTDPGERQQFTEAQERYRRLLSLSHQAAQRLDPMVAFFDEQAVFIQYNLNPKALARLHDERAAVETAVAALVGELENAIGEADALIDTLRAAPVTVGYRL